MILSSPQNGRQSLTKDDLPVDTTQQEEKRKTATIMEERSDGLHEMQKMDFLTFGNEQAARRCRDDDGDNNNNNNKF